MSHARDTETHVWIKDGRHWTPRAGLVELSKMTDRELKMDYWKWSRQHHKETKRENQREL